MKDVTLAQAAAADARLAAAESAPLLGVPLAHKDIFVTRDFVTTAGSKMLAGYRSPFDATVVQRLAQAGRRDPGQAQLRRIRHGVVQRKHRRRPYKPAAEPLGHRATSPAARPAPARSLCRPA
jgi:aspartyl-tRNA(Asn)/glutamyl-tRNA(Gln) amidotransferase subunit A